MPVWLTWTAISAFLSTVRGWVVVTAVAGAVMSGAYLINEYSARGVKIENLKGQVEILNRENTALEGRVATYKAQVEVEKERSAELEKALADRSGPIEAICKAYIKQEFNRDPDSMQCIDPTVGEALEDIRKIEEGEKK